MHPKDLQLIKLQPGDRLTSKSSSNIRGNMTLNSRGGVLQRELPEDSPHRGNRWSGAEPAKQGPLQPGKDFKESDNFSTAPRVVKYATGAAPTHWR